MSTLLTVKSLNYDTSTSTLLNDISFTVQQGDRIGLIGHNGSGKSTLLKLITQQLSPNNGSITYANHCVTAYIEQHLPDDIASLTLLDALVQKLPEQDNVTERWRAEVLLSELGFTPEQWEQKAYAISGGQHTRLLLGRALIEQPDLLLLDEPSNHLDLPTLIWLGNFLQSWKGSFVLVSHDQSLLDKVSNCTWILRDKSLHFYRLPCSAARQALSEKDITDARRNQAEQKEIDRIASSAKRLAIWGHVYDNEALSRKAKQMEKHIDRLKDAQTELTEGYQWKLALNGKAIPADRVLELEYTVVSTPNGNQLFKTAFHQVKSGDRIAIMGANGCGKSTLLRLLWQCYQQDLRYSSQLKFHPAISAGYYDQQLEQLNDNDSLLEALRHFAPLTDEQRKMALIGAGFAYSRHQQKVVTLSGGERARLLFIGLSLAQYELILLDEPTNHLDLEGKEALCEQISLFSGALLVVSHDRWLIENSCQRFWFIDDNRLEEYLNVDDIYHKIELQSQSLLTPTLGRDVSVKSAIKIPCEEDAHEDELLETLLILEQKLLADQKRKLSHQKPQLQQQWINEIAQIHAKLGL
ncbi:ABC-F family ATP-binding cassette domain-containing protein [Providencia rettgeri]|uniref:ABC-F family ATP-binding cassette domain-containing protein n=1 Tax=Providencia rettgeri TaxID=587 RepID=UPI001B39A37A|nr:ABC-F family ATP-binding cassette domain-containing protein [Providencia rettgeri]EHZ7765892.1 ABC-F family ATP-binding cassette domain-containing protein [Providencia rettgeri]EIJ7169034.1 ABC-F family ATP-binding cassette domain-containing protein [Providencia rettgeri]EJD6045803.1 ABC-F family ATP-binding cassette domain-containing protein [Providencia rettgeri]ELR5089518.1 ABC-F family ATP-binding cassette domain-containing protein [Providencia rettgeri]ELR5104320.1 ABC-F family ATP-bin